MIRTLQALHVLLTGVETKDVPTQGDPWLPCIVPSLAGLNIIMGFDRLADEVPESAYPYMLIEASGGGKSEREYARRLTVIFDIGVKQTGMLSALFGSKDPGILEYSEHFEKWFTDNQVLRAHGKINALSAELVDFKLSAKGRSGPRSAKRYATYTVDYTIRREQ